MAEKEDAKPGSLAWLKKVFTAYDLAQQADGFGADAGAGSEGASGASSDEKEWDQLLKQMKATHLMLHFSINEGQLQYVISNQNKPLSSENLKHSPAR